MIYFCTIEYIKNKTQANTNVDSKDLAPFTEVSVDKYIVPILGYNFTKDLLTKYNDETLNTEETELVENFIQKVVAFYTVYEAAPNITFKLSNKGIVSQSGEYEASEGISVVDYIRRNMLSTAEVYRANLRAYLYENKSDFPLYSDPTNNEIQSPDKSSGANSNVSWL